MRSWFGIACKTMPPLRGLFGLARMDSVGLLPRLENGAPPGLVSGTDKRVCPCHPSLSVTAACQTTMETTEMCSGVNNHRSTISLSTHQADTCHGALGRNCRCYVALCVATQPA